ncbi:glycosyltransferase family 2 protein [Thermostilla marina]
MPKISVVIPVYNAQSTLPALIERLHRVLSDLAHDYEIICVDDAGKDDSWRLLCEARRADKRVKIIQHARNFGQHFALLTGLAAAKGEFVVTMDDDLQHPPEEIVSLYEALTAHPEWDVVFGAYTQKRHSFLRNVGSSIVNVITRQVFHVPPNISLTSFRIMRRWLAETLCAMPTRTPRLNHMILAATTAIGSVEVRHDPGGKSRYSTRRLISNALDTILGHTALPLQLVSLLGFCTSLFSFALGLYYLAKYFISGIRVPGWTTQTLLMLFFFGLLFFSLGIVGEYLIRILRQVQSPPRAAVRESHVDD